MQTPSSPPPPPPPTAPGPCPADAERNARILALAAQLVAAGWPVASVKLAPWHPGQVELLLDDPAHFLALKEDLKLEHTKSVPVPDQPVLLWRGQVQGVWLVGTMPFPILVQSPAVAGGAPQ